MEQSLMNYPLEWNRIQISFPSGPMVHSWNFRHVGLKKNKFLHDPELREHLFLFFSVSAFLCVLPGTLPLPISNFLLRSSLYYWNSTQTGVDVIHSFHSTFLWSLPNFDSASTSTLSRNAMLHECSKTFIFLWTQSNMSDLKKRFPRRLCHIAAQSGQFVMAMWPWPDWGDPRHPSSPHTPLKISLWYYIAPEWWW